MQCTTVPLVGYCINLFRSVIKARHFPQRCSPVVVSQSGREELAGRALAMMTMSTVWLFVLIALASEAVACSGDQGRQQLGPRLRGQPCHRAHQQHDYSNPDQPSQATQAVLPDTKPRDADSITKPHPSVLLESKAAAVPGTEPGILPHPTRRALHQYINSKIIARFRANKLKADAARKQQGQLP